MADDLERIGSHCRGVAHDLACAFDILIGNHRDCNTAAGAAHDLLLVTREHLESAAADRANAEQPHVNRFHHSNPSLRNISFMPRKAWRVRASFSMRANLTWPLPSSPKPTPGDTATFASASNFLENSSDPICWYGSGIGAHTYIVALGFSTGHNTPASPAHI